MPLRALGPQSKAADQFFDAVMDPQAFATPLGVASLLEPIAEVVGAEVIGWHRVDLASGESNTILWPQPALQSLAERMMLENHASHPLLAHYFATRTLDILEPRDICSPRQWLRSDAYRIIIETFGVGQQLAIPVGYTNGIFISLAMGRSGQSFLARERDSAWWIQHSLRAATGRRHPGNSDTPLSLRELQVLEELRTGATRASAARELRMAPRTLDKHFYRKLEAKCLVEALAKTGGDLRRRH